ncbi:hypothetical protein [Rhodopseudomonas sp. WA056]|uniref:hypothetical protein n=1 Tax=Rhodopseudomonas sp. WA056 TaxID=2269367 RepID=UPI0013DFD10B|nr:hypothetical protein [Rhodopseudomonas sp. WA056]
MSTAAWSNEHPGAALLAALTLRVVHTPDDFTAWSICASACPAFGELGGPLLQAHVLS